MAVTNRRQVSTPVLVYVILFLSLQVFLLTVAIEAFVEDDEGLAWATTVLSGVLALASGAFYRYLGRD